MLQWAMGDVAPLSVTGSGGRQKRTDPKFGNVYEHFAVVYEYPNGAKAYFRCRQQSNTSLSYAVELVGWNGKCVVDCRTGVHKISGSKPWKYEDETKFTDKTPIRNRNHEACTNRSTMNCSLPSGQTNR